MTTFVEEVASASFAHGYLVLAGAPAPDGTGGWSRRQAGKLTYLTHPRTVLAHAGDTRPRAPWSEPRPEIVLLGHPVDVRTSCADAGVLARRLLATLRDQGVDAAVRQAAYWGGRFTAFLHHAHGMTVVPDAHATQPVFWSSRGRRVAVGSHAALVADALEREPDEGVLALFDGIRAIRPKGTIYFPGTWTPWRDVRPLIANCRLDIRTDRRDVRVEHRRFWPFAERVEVGRIDQVYDRFREHFLGHLSLLGSFGRVAVSLTAGLDSRVTLAGMQLGEYPDAFAFTYAHPEVMARDTNVARDAFGANELAFRSGMHHRLLHWRKPEDCSMRETAEAFTAAHHRSWPEQRGSVGAAYTMFAELARDVFELQSSLAETGTTHMRDRTSEPISPRRLAVSWLGRAFAERREYHPAFAEYIEYADFSTAQLQGYDHHDLFYWEHRMSRWASRKFQEGDMSHRVLLPFNDRGLVETMLQLPQPQRAAKVLYERILDEVPQLRDVARPDATGPR